MENVWEQVDKTQFDSSLKDKILRIHTVTICDPPITFIWDESLLCREGFDQYDDAIGKIIRDRDLKAPYAEKPEYYLNRKLIEVNK